MDGCKTDNLEERVDGWIDEWNDGFMFGSMD